MDNPDDGAGLTAWWQDWKAAAQRWQALVPHGRTVQGHLVTAETAEAWLAPGAIRPQRTDTDLAAASFALAAVAESPPAALPDHVRIALRNLAARLRNNPDPVLREVVADVGRMGHTLTAAHGASVTPKTLAASRHGQTLEEEALALMRQHDRFRQDLKECYRWSGEGDLWGFGRTYKDRMPAVCSGMRSTARQVRGLLERAALGMTTPSEGIRAAALWADMVLDLLPVPDADDEANLRGVRAVLESLPLMRAAVDSQRALQAAIDDDNRPDNPLEPPGHPIPEAHPAITRYRALRMAWHNAAPRSWSEIEAATALLPVLRDLRPLLRQAGMGGGTLLIDVEARLANGEFLATDRRAACAELVREVDLLVAELRERMADPPPAAMLNGAHPPIAPPAANPADQPKKRRKIEARAIALLLDWKKERPDWDGNHADVADALGCTVRSLHRSTLYKTARDAWLNRPDRRDPDAPRGRRKADTIARDRKRREAAGE